MNIKFDGKLALVTGAGRGIGREIVKKLVECGASIYALDKTTRGLESLKQECPSIQIVLCDLADRQATSDAIQSCGPIDLLVNNAGVAVCEPFLDTTLDSYDKTMEVNFRAPLQISQIVAKGMINRDSGGSIVNISSQVSTRGAKNYATYSSSKAALDQLTRTMCLELGKYNIRVNSVNPTYVYTPLVAKLESINPGRVERMKNAIPLGRLAELDDVVSVVLFLLSGNASMVNGSCIPVDGGCLACLVT